MFVFTSGCVLSENIGSSMESNLSLISCGGFNSVFVVDSDCLHSNASKVHSTCYRSKAHHHNSSKYQSNKFAYRSVFCSHTFISKESR